MIPGSHKSQFFALGTMAGLVMLAASAWAGAPVTSDAKPLVLLVRNSNDIHKSVALGFDHEIRDSMQMHTFRLNHEANQELLGPFSRRVQRISPDLVILLGEQALDLYRLYLTRSRPQFTVPSLTLMVRALPEKIGDLPRAVGIHYHVHGITSLGHLRALLDRPIQRIGVIYRASYVNQFEEQRRLCASENLTLVGQPIEDGMWSRRRMRRALVSLLEDPALDALWIPDDHVILKGTLIKRVWRPVLQAFDKPVVVGDESLVAERLALGHLAVVPDHYSLGKQAANLVLGAKAKQWLFEKTYYYPLGVMKILNLKLLGEDTEIREKVLSEIDEVIE